MDFKQLNYFIEIANEKNITRAAEKLFVSQSAVNQYLLKLENELGTQLFIRNRRNLELTAAGKIYLEGCKKAMLVRNDTMNAIHDIVESRTSSLSVGLTPTRGLTMFTSVYPDMKKEFPGLNITPIEMGALAQQQAAAAGEIDLAFMILPNQMMDTLNYIDLGPEEIVLIVPDDHPVCKKNPRPESANNILPVISLEEVSDMPFALTRSNSTFRRMCDGIIKKAGFSPEVLLETSNTSHIADITETMQCCGLIPYYYADTENDHYRCFALNTHPQWHLYLAHRQDAYLTLAAKEFIRLVREYWNSHVLVPECMDI